MSEPPKCQCCDLPVNQCRCLLELLKFVSNPEELLKNPQAVAEFVEMMQGTRPGGASSAGGNSSYQIPLLPNAPAAMIFKAKTAYGDDG